MIWKLSIQQSDNLILDFGFPLNNTLKIVYLPLTEIAVVNQGWANYIIPSIMVCEIIHVILLYFQVTKSMRIVEVLDNDDSSTTY